MKTVAKSIAKKLFVALIIIYNPFLFSVKLEIPKELQDRINQVFKGQTDFSLQVIPVVANQGTTNQCGPISVLCSLGAGKEESNGTCSINLEMLKPLLERQLPLANKTKKFTVPCPDGAVLSQLNPTMIGSIARTLSKNLPIHATAPELVLLYLAACAQDPELMRSLSGSVKTIVKKAGQAKIFDQIVSQPLESHWLASNPLVFCLTPQIRYFLSESDRADEQQFTRDERVLNSMFSAQELSKETLEMNIIYSIIAKDKSKGTSKPHAVAAQVVCSGLDQTKNPHLQIIIYDTYAVPGAELNPMNIYTAINFVEDFLHLFQWLQYAKKQGSFQSGQEDGSSESAALKITLKTKDLMEGERVKLPPIC